MCPDLNKLMAQWDISSHIMLHGIRFQRGLNRFIQRKLVCGNLPLSALPSWTYGT